MTKYRGCRRKESGEAGKWPEAGEEGKHRQEEKGDKGREGVVQGQ